MRIRHIAWNLLGLTTPLGVAALAVPPLLSNIGGERFGLLALVWGLVGYAGVLDLGIGRSLTQMIGRLRGERQTQTIADAVATAAHITLFTGLAGAVAIALVVGTGASKWVNAPSVPVSEIQWSALLLAIILPAQAMSATYKGVNEAFLQFKGINLLRILLGTINFLGPYLVSLFTVELPWLTATLVASRLLALLVYRLLAHSCLRNQYAARTRGRYSTPMARQLLAFGGWVTVSSVIGPIIVQADRFVIASLLSAAAVTTFVIPYEMVMQTLALVGAVSTVLFPTLSRMIHEQPDHWRSYFNKWTLRVTLMMGMLCMLLAFNLPWLLTLWLGNRLDGQAIVVGQILCLGVFFNGLGILHYSLLHAQGRSQTTATLHAVELLPYMAALTLLITQFGLIGAAWAWTARAAIDAVALIYFSRPSKS